MAGSGGRFQFRPLVIGLEPVLSGAGSLRLTAGFSAVPFSVCVSLGFRVVWLIPVSAADVAVFDVISCWLAVCVLGTGLVAL